MRCEHCRNTPCVCRFTRYELRAAYEAGLRRAQELAKEHVSADVENPTQLARRLNGHWARLDFANFDQAIDAEVAKERL